MSEFTNTRKQRIEGLLEVFFAILNKDDALNTIKQKQNIIDHSIPSDIIILVDSLLDKNIPMNQLKTGVNKFLNIMQTTIKSYSYTPPEKDSFFDCCIKNNSVLTGKLKAMRPAIKQLNIKPEDPNLKQNLVSGLKTLLEYDNYYTIKENILFPLIEKNIKDFRCINVMWSFHDDIRKNLKELISILSARTYDLKEFNRLIGLVYFNMLAIIFREERILFPYINEKIPQDVINAIVWESNDIGFPFYVPKKMKSKSVEKSRIEMGSLNLKTGDLTAEQLILIFNHLPVDITYVDENDIVKFYSTPKKRIFTRTNAIIGRKVANCHPPESIHIVEEILTAFKSGSKDKASFWIKMKGDFILIQYFALRDEAGSYKGVIEVTQEVGEIRNLKGENRLLDWEK